MGINLKWEREFVYGKFEFEVIKAIQDFVKPGNVVYDVGAHVGYFTLLMAKLAGPRGYCFAFEPSPQICRRLEENIRRNKKKLHASIQILEMALFDEVGKKDFFLGGSTSTGRLIRFPGNVSKEKIIVVPLSTIDTLVEKGIPAPQLIKIDVEYTEDQVLRGAMGILEKNAPVLLCEIHSTENAVNCFKILRGLGYSMKDLNTGQVWDSQDKLSRGQILAVRGR